MAYKTESLAGLEAKARAIAEQMGYELVDVCVDKEPTGKYLRFYIDKEEDTPKGMIHWSKLYELAENVPEEERAKAQRKARALTSWYANRKVSWWAKRTTSALATSSHCSSSL